MAEQISDETQPKTPLTPEILIPRLGDILVERGVISLVDLNVALAHQLNLRKQGKNVLLGEVLSDMGLIDRQTLDQVITEQIIQLRSALQETNAQLEDRVQQRTQELQDALQKLSELSQLKSNFIANISHELRTPLTHIKGYVELLMSGTMGELGEAQINAMLVVQRATARLEQQIEDLIHFSLASRGEFTLHFTPFQVEKLVNTVAARSNEKALEKDVEILVKLPRRLPAVVGDMEKLLWAVMQLVDNAIKFTPGNGKVQIIAHQASELVELSVIDSGIGIPKKRYDEIFEPFHQLDGSATRRYGGTGLGLALVKQIIEAHGSNIEIESEEGKGTSFHFHLPIAE